MFVLEDAYKAPLFFVVICNIHDVTTMMVFLKWKKDW